MSLQRRQFVSWSLGAAALASVAPVAKIKSAFAGTADRLVSPRVVLLRMPGDLPFAKAAEATLRAEGVDPAAELTLSRSLVFDPASLAHALAGHAGGRFFGLMDGSTRILIEEALRDLSGTILCSGWHAGGLGEIAPSRHSFVTGRVSAGIGAAMSHAYSGGAALCVKEDCIGIRSAEAVRPAELPRDDWPGLLGTALARIAAGRWRAGPVVREAWRGGDGAAPRHAAWASILAEIPNS